MTETATRTVHECVDCRQLPDAPAGHAGLRLQAGYAPAKSLPCTGGPRSRRCTFHARAKRDADRARARSSHKSATFGLTPDLQTALWDYQGNQCPSGAKVSAELPAGVATDHVHRLAGCQHPADRGCLDCVTGFLSAHVNTEIVGRLSGVVGRDQVPAALRRIADFLEDPPLPRLLAERPELDPRTRQETAA